MTAVTSRLFGGVELAMRLERAEARMLAECAEAARRRDPSTGARVVPIAGGVAVWAGEGQPFNKVAGLGFGGAVEPAELEAAERLFADHGAPVRVELPTLADPAIGALLTRRGYVLEGFENVLALALPVTATGRPTAGVEVAESGPDELGLWIDLVIDGFAHPDGQGTGADEEFPREVLERTFADMSAAQGFVRYLAWCDGQPAGGAGLRLTDGVAQLCGAATVPGHRRRGVQSALLGHRLTAAAAVGCDLATVTTQPGSRSQQNVQRLGFDLLYARAVLVRQP